eukprot:TRINITY_DN188_c3_g1_i1.p1 TRINITY_DN188_c3_g1~~TRINITY_DN188_c3_g1_i1.p1  ORF type:complete len:633 (+),score=121.47 TRINITY_DN188_c3_g1_i1:61-1959(+)
MSSGELRECFAMLRRDKNGGVTIDIILEFLQKLTSRRKVTKQQLMDWSNQPEGEPINLSNFSQLAEMTRVACEQGTISAQVEKMRRVFVGEIFTIIDTNKDGKISRSEVETFLCGCDIPEPLTPSDVRDLFRIGDIGNNLSKEDFNMIIIDIFLDEGDRAGFLPILVKCARKELENRTQQKLRAIASFSKVVGKMRSFSIKNGSFAPSHTQSPPDSPTSPSSTQTLEQEVSSPVAGGSIAPSSPSSLGPDLVKRKSGKWSSWKSAAASTVSGKKSAAAAAQQQQQLEEIKNLKIEASRLTNENDRLSEENRNQRGMIDKLDKELHLYSSTASLNTDSLKQQLFQYQNEISQLRPLKTEVETLNGQLLAKQSQINTLLSELSQQKELYSRETEKARELAAIRKQEQQESLRYKTELSKIKVQLRQLDEEVIEKQKTIERMEFDKRVEAIEAAGLNTTVGGLMSTNKFGDTTDYLDPPESSDLDGVLFLNPPKHVETADTLNSTLFESAGPIYYTLASPIRPSQLMFDIKISSSSVSEYITCRDDNSNRSLSLTIDQSFVSIPATAVSFKLSEDWNTVSVTFSWQRQSYSLFLGSMKVCSDQAFRDNGVSNVAAFDIYPRTDSSILYANIRFLY